jgi:hypothetical protein
MTWSEAAPVIAVAISHLIIRHKSKEQERAAATTAHNVANSAALAVGSKVETKGDELEDRLSKRIDALEKKVDEDISKNVASRAAMTAGLDRMDSNMRDLLSKIGTPWKNEVTLVQEPKKPKEG